MIGLQHVVSALINGKLIAEVTASKKYRNYHAIMFIIGKIKRYTRYVYSTNMVKRPFWNRGYTCPYSYRRLLLDKEGRNTYC